MTEVPRVTQDRGAKQRRYQNAVKGRMEVLRRVAIYKNIDARTLRKIAIDDLKPKLKEYEKQRLLVRKLYEQGRRTEAKKAAAGRQRLQEALALDIGRAYGFLTKTDEQKYVGES